MPPRFTVSVVIKAVYKYSCSICRKHLSLPIPCNEDDAVAKERRRVTSSGSNEDLLVLRNLTKVYGSRWSSQYRLAVNQLCLRMKKAEVHINYAQCQ